MRVVIKEQRNKPMTKIVLRSLSVGFVNFAAFVNKAMVACISSNLFPCKIIKQLLNVKSLRFLYGSPVPETLQKRTDSQSVEKVIKDYRCRDYVKLKGLDKKYRLIEPGFKVLDLGAAPGSWSQYLAEKTNALGGDGPKGVVIAMDVKNFENIEGVHVLPEMDFTKEFSQKKILEILGRGQKFDCIFSDILPPLTGVKSFDEKRMEGGSCVIKIQGAEYNTDVTAKAKQLFSNVILPETKLFKNSKPEVYLLGKNFMGKKT